MKANGIEATSLLLSESPRSVEAGVCQWRASRAMWPPTALCLERLANGEHVVGQWCSLIVMKNEAF